MKTVRQAVNANAYSLLGFRVDTSDGGVVRFMAETIAAGKSHVVANHNMHSLYMWYQDAKMREFFALADYAHIDGMSLVLLGRILGLPLKKEHRTTYLDLLPPLAAEAAMQGWRIFFLGSKPGVGDKAADVLRQKYPGLQIRAHHGHFDTDKSSQENQSVLSEITAYGPQILMVGMGMPRQELWILENRQELSANVICTGGAIMDYIAGVVPTPPRWLGPLYLEWLYRLIMEPTRLSRRYLVEPWFVLRKMTIQYLRNGRLPIAADATHHG
jgi:N-acetylglucosaminyldiphosphoundecaprenol N-acetyl-beta-D-mannosaminyltransferase